MRFIAVFCILNIHHIEHTACKASKVFSFRDEHLHVSESQCSLRPSWKLLLLLLLCSSEAFNEGLRPRLGEFSAMPELSLLFCQPRRPSVLQPHVSHSAGG